MATISHFSSLLSLSSRNRLSLDLSQSQYQQQPKLHWFSNRQPRSFFVASLRKSRAGKKAKSDAELCNDIREFIKSVGLPEDHVPSTKELSQHGRNDLANIVRRRGYKLLRELLTNSIKKLGNDCDTENIILAGQNGEAEGVVEDLSSLNRVLIVEKFSPISNTDHATWSDDCNSASIYTANSSVVEELAYDSELCERNNKSHKENGESIDKVEEDISLETEVTAVESYFSGLNVECNDYNGEATEFSPNLHSVEKSLYSLECRSETINSMVDASFLSPEVLSGENYLRSSAAGEDLNVGGLDDKPMLLPTGSPSKEEALYTNELVEKEDNNVDDISPSVEMTIMDDHSSDLDADQALVHEESSHKSIKVSENSSLKEKVAKFIQSGDLDMIDDNFNIILSENGAVEIKGFIGAGNNEKIQIDTRGEAHSEEVVNRGYNVIASESGHIKSSTTVGHFFRDDQPLTEVVSGQNGTELGAEERGNDKQVEIDRLKFMLHQKELELSQLKEQIEREKLALSDLQNKAETEISKVEKLSLEKDTELYAAEESLSGLEEVQIHYHGDGEIVEVAGSFNGWHHRIKMDPQPSSNIVDSINSRKSRLWSAVLWLYPGVYEIKFIVDGHWRIDPHRESVSKGAVCNNILRVDDNTTEEDDDILFLFLSILYPFISFASRSFSLSKSFFLALIVIFLLLFQNPSLQDFFFLIKMEYENRFRQAQRPKYDCLLFDLDDTLYSLSTGIAAACLKNIKDYLVEKLGIEKTKIPDLCNLLYKNYGTTMAGLRAIGYDFDYDEYHSFVHGRLPYDNLKPDPVLRNLLLSLPYRKVIFTNADKDHAVKVLKKLGLEDCFGGIICFETLNPIHKTSASVDEDDIEFLGSLNTIQSAVSSNNGSEIFDIIGHFLHPKPGLELPKTPIVCKPSEAAIEKALKIAGLDPQRTLFFEDSVRNVQAGKRVGLDTVLIGTSQRVKGADYALESIHNLREGIPELWNVEIKSERSYAGKVAVETSVTA